MTLQEFDVVIETFEEEEKDTQTGLMALRDTLLTIPAPGEKTLQILTGSRAVAGLLAKNWRPFANHGLVDEVKEILKRFKRVQIRLVRGQSDG